MRYQSEAGQVIYYNPVEKHGRVRWVIQAASGQVITGRDRQKLKSRTFAQEHQADAWLERNGYKAMRYT
ncbi:MAG: hypothetical protein K2L38_05095 [Dysosmobacter sp.]|nr:hypothetical protein [Dysosmobacter sp.]